MAATARIVAEAAVVLLLLVACPHGGHAISSKSLRNGSLLAHLKPSVTGVGAKKPFVKHDTLVPMRDGVGLNTITFVPFHVNPKATFAAVLIRTPYGATGLKDEGQMYVDQGFAVVMQDFRGRFASQGTFHCWWNASTDGLDTIDWVRSQPWSSGVVFSTGTSANGIAAYLEMVAAPSPQQLAAQFVTVGTPTLHSMMYQGGAFRESLIAGWLAGISESWFVANITAHEPLGNYWDNVSMAHPAKWDNVKIPAVHLTGWYDIFVEWTIDAYDAYRRQNDLNFLIVLPSGHCPGGQIDWPDADDGASTAAALAVQMFKALLENQGDGVALSQTLKDTPHVQWYVLGPGLNGTVGNYWVTAEDFPKSKPLSLYLANANNLVNSTVAASSGKSSFVYNPADPVPTLGGNNLLLPKCGPWDQSVLYNRSDILSFTSEPLQSHLAVTGSVSAELFLSTSAVDTDFTAKLIDVFPDGRAMLVQDGIQRMRFLQDPSSATPVVPGHVYAVNISIWRTSYVFNPGHRIQLDISSSNFPRFSANPNTGQPLAAGNATKVVATNTVLFGSPSPSRLVLPQVSLSDLPPTTLAV